ncbi:MAG: hypothetical protein GVY20_09280 [Bacteroidetes bacterium]|jgi:hypothetical protein|nr:hypothetical protein [Bacteroidota bacterium]
MDLHSVLLFCVALAVSSCSSDLNGLAGEWVAEDLSAGNLGCSEDLEGDYVLSLDTDSRSYGLELDVNGCGGTLENATDGKIEFKGPACTEACCDSEGALCLLDALLMVDAYELTSNNLILVGNDVRILFSPLE